MHCNKCSNDHDRTVSLTVVLSRRTRLDAPESGLKVTILEVENTGRRNSFPAHSIWTSSRSPDRAKLKVSYIFRQYVLCKRHAQKTQKKSGVWLTQHNRICEESRTDIRITDLFISTTTLLLTSDSQLAKGHFLHFLPWIYFIDSLALWCRQNLR